MARLRNLFRRERDAALDAAITEAAGSAPGASAPERAGFVYGIPRGGLNEYNSSVGASTQTDRRSLMQQLYEAYLSCPWAWTSVQAIARTITAGGLVTDWDTDDGEGDQEAPDKPERVLALERFLEYCNDSDDIRQVMRNVVTDLLVFGDAFLEVVFVGDLPVSLYNLDEPTMYPVADEHGQVSKYVQITEFGQRAEFAPHEVIHIKLDAPRSGVFGISPTQAALLPITAWLFAAATGKEIMRKGLPVNVHVDFPNSQDVREIGKWTAQYMQQNVGPRNIGRPITTKGGGHVTELQAGKIPDVAAYLDQKRDEIIACYGVPPAKANIIESGNLGGGTGDSQDKTFKINTCQPLAELILEKINFHIVRNGFGVEGWHLKFKDIDYRDSQIIELIRDTRLRNGSWTLNRYRSDIGEPSVAGGDDAVLVDRQNLVKWADMDAASKAGIASKLKGTALEPAEPLPGEPVSLEKPAPAPVPPQLAPFAGTQPPGNDPGDDTADDTSTPAPNEAILLTYRRRLGMALMTLPGLDERAAA